MQLGAEYNDENLRQAQSMNFGVVLLILALAAGGISGYTTRVWLRVIHVETLVSQGGLYRQIVGSLSFVAMLAALVWGFVFLTWWWVILIFLGVSIFLIPLVVTRDSAGFMLGIQPLFDTICIVLTVYLWVSLL